jgi:hypothetical protein
MHDIEPYYNWRHIYTAEEDKQSPFFGRTYDYFQYSNTIYNYYIHPQWDEIGSPTLYIKLLIVDYTKQFAVIECIGEWNDCINNDIMSLKREVIDVLIKYGIRRFMLMGENVLNFHASDDCYYEEWYDDIKDDNGWVALVNFRDHVIKEMLQAHLEHFLIIRDDLMEVDWRKIYPLLLPHVVEQNEKPSHKIS